MSSVPPVPQPTVDDLRQLDLLVLFLRIHSGIVHCFGTFPLIHFSFGLAALLNPHAFDSKGSSMPPYFGLLFLVLGGGFFLVLQGIATCGLFAAAALQSRTRYTLVMGVFIASLMMQPVGLALGIFGLIVMSRPAVKALFSS